MFELSSVDGDGFPLLSLRDDACAMPEDEITCHAAKAAHVVAKSLPAGTYYLAVAATAPPATATLRSLLPWRNTIH